jgi:predicted phosphodiesterase
LRPSWIKAAKLVDEIGIDEAMIQMGWSRKSLQRAVQRVRNENGINGANCEDSPVLVRKIIERYTEDELRAIAYGKTINPHQVDEPVIDFSGDEVVIGFVTDTHIGSKYFNDSLWYSFIQECERQNVQTVLHAGDLIEGMSNRPDQIYSLTDIGFSAQMDHATTLLADCPFPVYIIDGNHDRWGIKSGGMFAVKDIANRLDNVTFIGHDLGDVIINGTIWRLWHGEDGGSYATSYRLQKIIESLTGGEKPNVLLCGHTHKQAYIFERNIHTVSGGALSYQSAWMQSKRLANHTGFHIIRATIKDGQIMSFSPTFYPFYK